LLQFLSTRRFPIADGLAVTIAGNFLMQFTIPGGKPRGGFFAGIQKLRGLGKEEKKNRILRKTLFLLFFIST